MSDLVYLLECKPYDPVVGATKNVYFSNGLDTESSLGTADPYPVRLSQAFAHETSIFEDNIPGQTNISIGSAVINNADGRFDFLMDLSWDSRYICVKKGFKGAAYSTFTTEFVGSSVEITADLTNLVLTLRDNSYKLVKPLQPNKYAGSGGAEGGSDLKNRRKPLLFGKARNLVPVGVDSVLLTMQIHDGAIASVEGIFDRANPLTFHADYATYALLIAANIPPGRYGTSLATGFVRLGAPPAGLITADATGQYSTSTNIPELAKQILLDRGGLTTADLNVTAFTEASSDAPQNYEGIFLAEPDFQVDEMLETLSSAINGFWFVNRVGLITFRQFKFRTPVATIRSEDLLSLGKAPSPSPLYRVRVNYAKNPTVMNSGDFNIPRQTFNGYLTRRYHYVDTSVGSPDYSGAGQFKVFLNDTPANDFSEVQFRIPNGESWITIDSLGVITVTNPGSTPASAVVRANLGEFFIDETFTVVKDSSAPLQSLYFTFVGDRLFFNDMGVPTPTTQDITVSHTGTNLTAPVTYTAADNLSQNVPLTGGTVLSISNVSRSPLVFWVEVTATDANGIVQKQRVMVQRGDDGYAAGALSALSVANKAITIFYQTAAPTTGMQVDDIWVDTDDANKQYRWNGSSWVSISDTRIVDALTQAAGAQATADGKIKTYFGESTPTASAVGDLWYKASTKTLYRWSGSNWTTEVGTFGATAGTSLFNAGGSTLNDSQVQNSAITITAGGVLNGAGGGAVTALDYGNVAGATRPEDYATQTGVADNLLRDDWFGTDWAKHANHAKIVPAATSGYAAGAEPFALEMTISSASTRESIGPNVPVSPDTRYFFSGRLSIGTAASGQVDFLGDWLDSAGAVISALTGVSITAASLTAGAVPKEYQFSEVSPPTAAFVRLRPKTPAAGTTGHTFRIEAPRIARSGMLASISYGPSSVEVLYDYLGAAESGQLPRDLNYKLSLNGVEQTANVVWQWKVISGTVNTFTSSSGLQTLASTGTGVLSITSLGANTSVIELVATSQGSQAKFSVTLTKKIGDAPAGGGGGGGAVTLVSQTSGFISSGTSGAYATVTQAGDLDFTMPAGKTQVNVIVNLTSAPPNAVGGDPSRFWLSRMKVQRDIAAVWTDQGSVNGPLTTSSTRLNEGGGNFWENESAFHSFTLNITGLTAGNSYSIRIQQDLDANPNAVENHTNTGTVTVVAP